MHITILLTSLLTTLALTAPSPSTNTSSTTHHPRSIVQHYAWIGSTPSFTACDSLVPDAHRPRLRRDTCVPFHHVPHKHIKIFWGDVTKRGYRLQLYYDEQCGRMAREYKKNVAKNEECFEDRDLEVGGLVKGAKILSSY